VKLLPLIIGFIALNSATAFSQIIEEITVVASSPIETEKVDHASGNIHVISGEDLRKKRSVSLAEHLASHNPSIILNGATSNPLQPDVQFRGFVGSSLLGLPQGLAVYLDGVRLNEPFGDTVNWALIPEEALETVYVIPGSNPLFGLNALGGSIVTKSKTGASYTDSELEISAGSFGRASVKILKGDNFKNGFSYFVSGSIFDESGWRDFSPTSVNRMFGNISWQDKSTKIEIIGYGAKADLIGNGSAPIQLLQTQRTSIYTRPDQSDHDLKMLNLSIRRRFNDWSSSKIWFFTRSSDIESLNGDESDFEECLAFRNLLCRQEENKEHLLLDYAGAGIAARDDLLGGTLNRSTTLQSSKGARWELQLNYEDKSSFIFGVDYNKADVDFNSSTELGTLDDSRRTISGGMFIQDALVRLNTANRDLNLFASFQSNLTTKTKINISGQQNKSERILQDQIGIALSGSHTFRRFNPAISITHDLGSQHNFYASHSKSNRTPSPVELTCADENDPCRLPNAFLSDPPLADVKARTNEIGLRKDQGLALWFVSIYETKTEDDILFVSSGSLTNEGFFSNIGETLRRGLEFGVIRKVTNDFKWSIRYSHLKATYEETLTLPSPHNPRGFEGEISISPGDRLPSLPSHALTASIDWQVSNQILVNLDLKAQSGIYYRGDEGNDLAKISGYGTVNLGIQYQSNKSLKLFLRAENIFNSDYSSFGVLGDPSEVLGDEFNDKRFLSPGQPRGLWVGLAYKL